MPKPKSRLRKVLLTILLLFFAVLIVGVIWFKVDTHISPPKVEEANLNKLVRETVGTDAYSLGNNWLRKNKYGLWEMYLEGEPFEMGLASGILTKELIFKQEEAFVEKIQEMVPSPSYLKFLKYFIAFFNRDIDEYILPEYQEEIYGISFSASDQFDFIGTNYERMLNYHGAHDIGHALQDLMLVGCTSFAANMGYADSSLIVGRNFDFYINDVFAEDKIVCFVNPEKGHKFTFVTWASFIGVVSGMNDKGLTVTINAGKSDIPSKAATPISLLAREILQYAGNIDEAIAIAKKRKTFVAESLLIGSAADNKAVIIEKSPSRIGVYAANEEFLVCSNHFQSEAFATDEANLQHKNSTATDYRQLRAEELILRYDTLNFTDAAEILRDPYGSEDISIGIGNEKTMAQMISHHSVIFQPVKGKMWVSTYPYQLGEYLGYNQQEVFQYDKGNPLFDVYDTTLTIPEDPFLGSSKYADFLLFREKLQILRQAIKNETSIDEPFITDLLHLNPDYYLGYMTVGDYYSSKGNAEEAILYYSLSLEKEYEKSEQRSQIESKVTVLKNN